MLVSDMLVPEQPRFDHSDFLVRELVQALQGRLANLPTLAKPVAEPIPTSPSVPILPPPQDLRANLVPFSDVLGHRPTTPTGILGLPVRLLRAFVRLVVGPWLDMQTLFNRAVVKTLVHEQLASRTYLEQLAHWVQQAADLRGPLSSYRSDLGALSTLQRVTIRQVAEAVEQSLTRRRVPAGEGNGASARVIEQVFLQAWLPRPPARLLACEGGEDGNSLELAGMGYQVNTVTPNSHPLVDLPYPDEAFDGIVCFSRPEDSAVPHGGTRWLSGFQRVLRRGGKIILSVPQQDARRTAPPLASDFRVLETAFAVQGDTGWTYTSDLAVVESLQARGGVNAVALIAAEKN